MHKRLNLIDQCLLYNAARSSTISLIPFTRIRKRCPVDSPTLSHINIASSSKENSGSLVVIARRTKYSNDIDLIAAAGNNIPRNSLTKL